MSSGTHRWAWLGWPACLLLTAVATLTLAAIAVPTGRGATAPRRSSCAKSTRAGGDWPTYGQDAAGDRDQRAEHRLGPGRIAGLKAAFVFNVANFGMSGDFQATPVESGGCVFMGTSTGWVFAINADSGRLVWRTKLPVGAAGLLGTGVVGSPTVSGGRVFVNVSQASAPYAAAISARSGKLLWRTTLDTRTGAYNDASPVVYKNVVLSGFNGDEEESATARGGYDLIDARTGRRLRHVYTIPDAAFKEGYTGGSMWATPAVNTGTGYAFVGTGNPAGTKQYPTTDAIVKIDLSRRRRSFGTIVAHYSGTPDAAVPIEQTPSCRATEGQIIYVISVACTHEDVDFGGSPLLVRNAKGRLLVGELQKSGIYHAIHADDLSRDWLTMIGSAAVITNGDSGATDGHRIYIEGTPPGQLVALDANSGRQLWLAPIGDQVHFEAITTANGVVYTVTSYNNFVAYDAATGAQLLNRPLALDIGGSMASQPNDTAASVSVARGTVYVANGGAIVAYRNGLSPIMRRGAVDSNHRERSSAKRNHQRGVRESLERTYAG